MRLSVRLLEHIRSRLPIYGLSLIHIYIDTSHLADIVKHLSTDAQESITVFLTANEGLMDLAFHKIKKEYGSTEKYLSKGLRLTDKKRERLKDILLY